MAKVTLKEYQQIAWNKDLSKPFNPDDYELIPDRPIEHDNPLIVKLINRYCLESDQRTPTKLLWIGSTFGQNYYDIVNYNNGFEHMDKWSTSYREVYTNPVDLVVFTYCEGDIHISLHSTEESYDEEIESCIDFYERQGY